MSDRSEWREMQLGDLLKVKHGFAFKGAHFGSSGSHVVLTPGNFYDGGGFKHKGSNEKWYSGPIPPDFVLCRGDLIVAMTEQAEGLLGSAAIVPDSNLYLHNQRLGLVDTRDECAADKGFLYYLFNSPEVRKQLRASATGTKVRHTAPSRIYAVSVRVPRIRMQQRIAHALNTYDVLINNNERRVRILEEMVQALYHDSLATPPTSPTTTLGELAQEVRRNVSGGTLEQPTPYVGLEHIPRRSLALDTWTQRTSLGSSKLEFRTGEILFGKIRPYFHKVSIAPFDGICSADTIVIQSLTDEHWSLVAATVFSDDFVAHASATANGAKMPRANWSILKQYEVALPPAGVAARFSQVFRSVVAQMQTLVFQIHNLRATRDLLLPRLMSGQLELKDVA